jgi:hypothetical protein
MSNHGDLIMATFIDEEGRQDTQPVEVDTTDLEAPKQEAQPSEVEAVPYKYQGKSPAELVRMHQEAERMLGRQSGEVGDLRKVVDEFVMSQSSNKETSEPEEEIDYFSDPEKAMQRAIDKHPSVVEAKQASTNMKRQSAQSILKDKHPDMKEMLLDSNFTSWVGDSNFRTRLLQEADRNFDYEAADEVFSMWKERQSLIGQTTKAEKQNRTAAVKSASTGGSAGTSQTSSKKIFRRADIIKLMRNDPNRYEALSDEIMAAYAEGRVK